MTPQEIKQRAERLEQFIINHPAHNNEFFDSVKQGRKKWTTAQLSIIGPQYYYFTRNFPSSLSKLIARVSSEITRNLLVQILYSELGGRHYKQAHYRLFYSTLSSIRIDENTIDNTDLFDETLALVEGIDDLFNKKALPTGLGAEYALEIHANPMIEGLCNGFPGVDHEFFNVHAVDEPQHIINVRTCLLEDECVKNNWPQVEMGAKKILDLFNNFWQKIYNETKNIK